jgi:hypothetical protein
MNLERARLENPKRKELLHKQKDPAAKWDDAFTEEENECIRIHEENKPQTRKEFQIITYEYEFPFNYPNFKVELGDETKGAEYNTDGIELDVPPYGAITFVEDEPIVGVSVIASSCCSPGTVYIHCEPVVWKYPRSGVKFMRNNLWGEHLRAYTWRLGITEQYKKCGMFSADFNIPDSKKITIMGHGGFDMEQRDYDTNHYDSHLLVRAVRVSIKREKE